MNNDLKALLKGKPFIKVYLDLLAVDDFSLLEVLILSIVLSFNVNKQKCLMTTNDFRWTLGTTKRAIEKAFLRLKDKKYLEIVHLEKSYKQEKRLTDTFFDRVWNNSTPQAENDVTKQIKAFRKKLNIKHED